MNRPNLYDDDILEWSEQQGAALRKLAQVRHDLSNELDWEHVAEEIEDVGRSELATVQSLTRQILIHLIKAISVPDKQLILNWRREATAFRDEILDRVSPSMLRRIDIDALWQRAISQAEADLDVHGQTVLPSLPNQSPLAMAQILKPAFDFITLAETLRNQFASNGEAR
jgi:hypothetical protein